MRRRLLWHLRPRLRMHRSSSRTWIRSSWLQLGLMRLWWENWSDRTSIVRVWRSSPTHPRRQNRRSLAHRRENRCSLAHRSRNRIRGVRWVVLRCCRDRTDWLGLRSYWWARRVGHGGVLLALLLILWLCWRKATDWGTLGGCLSVAIWPARAVLAGLHSCLICVCGGTRTILRILLLVVHDVREQLLPRCIGI